MSKKRIVIVAIVLVCLLVLVIGTVQARTGHIGPLPQLDVWGKLPPTPTPTPTPVL